MSRHGVIPLGRFLPPLPLPFFSASWACLAGGDVPVMGSKKLSESRSSSSSSSEKAVRDDDDDELEESEEATLDRGTTSRVAAPPSTLLSELDTKHWKIPA